MSTTTTTTVADWSKLTAYLADESTFESFCQANAIVGVVYFNIVTRAPEGATAESIYRKLPQKWAARIGGGDWDRAKKTWAKTVSQVRAVARYLAEKGNADAESFIGRNGGLSNAARVANGLSFKSDVKPPTAPKPIAVRVAALVADVDDVAALEAAAAAIAARLAALKASV